MNRDSLYTLGLLLRTGIIIFLLFPVIQKKEYPKQVSHPQIIVPNPIYLHIG